MITYFHAKDHKVPQFELWILWYLGNTWVMNLDGTLCWGAILYGSLVFLCILQVRHQLPFFWTIFSRMFVKQTTLRYRDSVSLWSKGQACLLFITNDSGFLNSRFPYCRAIHYVGKYPLAFSALLFGNWGLGKLAPKCWISGYCLYSFSIAAI